MAANQVQAFYAPAAGLLLAARVGTLATSAGNLPHAALVTPALGAHGWPVLLLSELSAHTRQLRQNPACALLVAGPAPEANPQTAPRLVLTGVAQPTNDPDAAARFLQLHPYAQQYAGFADFNFWELRVQGAHYVGGFAAAAALDAAALQQEIKSARRGPDG